MKKRPILASILAFFVAIPLSSCNNEQASSSPNSSPDATSSFSYNAEIFAIYEQYAAEGGTLSYEEWLESIQGKDGKDGHSPVITIGDNGNWFIDGVDTGVLAKGEKGDKGDEGDPGSDAPHYGETHTVTYHLNGGSMPEGVEEIWTVGWGDILDLPVPLYYGHVFEGWYTGEGVNIHKQWYSSDAVFADLDLYAEWSIGTYTLTLDPDGGIYEGETVFRHEYGSEYSLPTSVVKAGYTFLGWTLDGEIIPNSGDYLYEDITVIAAYEALPTHTITLNLNGGTYDGPTTITVIQGFEYVLPYEGVSNGEKVLKGWYDPDGSEWALKGLYPLNEDITLTAEWSEVFTYSVTADLNGGSLSSGEISSITNLDIAAGLGFVVPTKEGYEFLGYYVGGLKVTDSNGFITNINLLSTTETTSIVAKYVALDGSLSGDCAYLGEYPQTLVTETSLLNALAGATDTDNDGYLDYEGKEYLRVSGKGNNGYSESLPYYFEVEPIIWDVMSDNQLVSSKVIDAKQFHPVTTDRTYEGATVYANNYQYSDIRAFLNGYDGSAYEAGNYAGTGFIDIAFNEEEESKILVTEVDNTAGTTSKPDNPYFCSNTSDKVYLLSFQQALNDYPSEEFKIKEYTDYAFYNGLQVYNSEKKSSVWWTRSPNKYTTTSSDPVGHNGASYAVYSKDDVYYYHGVLPAMKIAL